jgi:hypothetical protein
MKGTTTMRRVTAHAIIARPTDGVGTSRVKTRPAASSPAKVIGSGSTVGRRSRPKPTRLYLLFRPTRLSCFLSYGLSLTGGETFGSRLPAFKTAATSDLCEILRN